MFDDINQFTTRGMRYEIERLDTSRRIMDMETGERVYFAPYFEEWQRSAEQLLAILTVVARWGSSIHWSGFISMITADPGTRPWITPARVMPNQTFKLMF